ncbi:hypothetical protein KVH27_34995 [Streptomyces olivaceus]|uniref:hypothetical protein n=1 Tax=Streptomyces olivaceus TaxID=47716 RepID=UPI001CC9A312|nr:hypothetical protein [Streptomyces olivaceus]MBZ6253559.1 hypothetical protein [Streptomyces olivaceus]
MNPHEPSRAYRLGELACDLVVAALLWWLFSSITAIVFFGLTRLRAVRRHHFLDWGRFTAGVIVGTHLKFLFGVALTRYASGGGVCGLEVLIGRHSLIVCAFATRDEWEAFERRNAERRAALKKGGDQ